MSKEYGWYLLALALVVVPVVYRLWQGGEPERVPGSHRTTDSADDLWLGLVYPEPSDLSHYEIVSQDRHLDECLRQVRLITAPGSMFEGGAYECGLNCQETGHSGVMRCERTVGNER